VAILKNHRRRREKAAKIPVAPPTPPGELTLIPGIEYQPTARITLIDFWGDHFVEKTIEKVEDCLEYVATASVTWINVEGLANLDVIQKIGEGFKLHPLAMEDVLHTRQRPKVDDYEEFLFMVFRELHDKDFFETEQISIFLGRNYLITFQETVGDPFDGVRDRIRKGRPRLRSSGPDYLAYALLDAVMDSYFPILDRYNARLDALEEEASTSPSNETPLKIQEIRRDLVEMRGVAWSTREMLSNLLRTESDLISKPTQPYLRDVYDHGVAVMEILDTYREIAAGLRDIYLSRVSVRTNEIMKALTLIATLFMPLTFLVGLYGMNFEKLPGKESEVFFWIFVFFMLAVALGMIMWFRKKHWI
jgi:magnesium transporter